MTHEDRPQMTGRQHWLEAERLLRLADERIYTDRDASACRLTARAHARALLALAAPAYALHQAAREVVADSPNIAPGENEAPVPFRGASA